MSKLTTSFATEMLSVLVGGQSQPDVASPSVPTCSLTDGSGGYLPNIPGQQMLMVYNGAQAWLNVNQTTFSTLSVVGSLNLGGFILSDSNGRDIIEGEADTPQVIDSSADVSAAALSIGGGLLPAANGYTSLADGRATVFGTHYANQFLNHYLTNSAFGSGPSELWVGLFSGDADWQSPPVLPSDELPVSRLQVAGGGFQISTIGDQVVATHTEELRWNNVPASTVQCVGLFDASTNGNCIGMSYIDAETIIAGNDVYIPAGSQILRIN
ncbi:MAG: hypothetical protein GY753_18890 [Gammaproteobacteria bacterium]|nr:hypothetical protein [Gammaproteobacteria bacterium]